MHLSEKVYGDAQVYGFARLVTFGPIGSRNGNTSYAIDSDTVMCGCFTGTLSEFANAVEETLGDNDHGFKYRALIEMLKTFQPKSNPSNTVG